MLAKHYTALVKSIETASVIRSVKEMLKADKARTRKMWEDRKAGK